MCNCGNKRSEFRNHPATPGNLQHDTAQRRDQLFQYSGKTALTLTGSATGRRYRFERPGDIQLIDVRDAAGITGINVLRKVN